MMAVPNGRDLGGLPASDGRTVRHGLVFRAAAPQNEDDAEGLSVWGITEAIDLRTHEERELRPATLPPTTQAIVADVLADEPDGGPASLGALARAAVSGDADALTPARLDEIFVAGYRSFVSLPSGRAATATVLRRAADPHSGPVLVHCTAGKDRTGWIVAALLLTLEVPWGDVMADYLASGPEVLALFAPFRDRVAAQGGDVEAMERAIAVFPHYLEAAHAEALRTFGSWHGYLADGLDLPTDLPRRLQARLLT